MRVLKLITAFLFIKHGYAAKILSTAGIREIENSRIIRNVFNFFLLTTKPPPLISTQTYQITDTTSQILTNAKNVTFSGTLQSSTIKNTTLQNKKATSTPHPHVASTPHPHQQLTRNGIKSETLDLTTNSDEEFKKTTEESRPALKTVATTFQSELSNLQTTSQTQIFEFSGENNGFASIETEIDDGLGRYVPHTSTGTVSIDGAAALGFLEENWYWILIVLLLILILIIIIAVCCIKKNGKCLTEKRRDLETPQEKSHVATVNADNAKSEEDGNTSITSPNNRITELTTSFETIRNISPNSTINFSPNGGPGTTSPYDHTDDVTTNKNIVDEVLPQLDQLVKIEDQNDCNDVKETDLGNKRAINCNISASDNGLYIGNEAIIKSNLIEKANMRRQHPEMTSKLTEKTPREMRFQHHKPEFHDTKHAHIEYVPSRRKRNIRKNYDKTRKHGSVKTEKENWAKSIDETSNSVLQAARSLEDILQAITSLTRQYPVPNMEFTHKSMGNNNLQIGIRESNATAKNDKKSERKRRDHKQSLEENIRRSKKSNNQRRKRKRKDQRRTEGKRVKSLSNKRDEKRSESPIDQRAKSKEISNNDKKKIPTMVKDELIPINKTKAERHRRKLENELVKLRRYHNNMSKKNTPNKFEK